MPATRARDAAREARRGWRAAWQALAAVEDPEIPALSIVDLGLIRFVRSRADGALEVGLSPTYVGLPGDRCDPALRARGAARGAGVGSFAVTTRALARLEQRLDHRRGPAQARCVRHRAAGATRISHARRAARDSAASPARAAARLDTEMLSEFGSTPCKALHRCRACLEPFEYFKCI